jgi:hypothetical protein
MTQARTLEELAEGEAMTNRPIPVTDAMIDVAHHADERTWGIPDDALKAAIGAALTIQSDTTPSSEQVDAAIRRYKEAREEPTPLSDVSGVTDELVERAAELVREWQTENSEWFNRDITEIVEGFAIWHLAMRSKEPVAVEGLVERVAAVVAKFEQDEAQGYRSSTRTYVLEMLKPVLSTRPLSIDVEAP